MKKLMVGFLAVALFGAVAQTTSAGWSMSVAGGFYAAPSADAVMMRVSPPVYVSAPRVVCAPAITPVVVAQAPVVYAPRPIVVYSAPICARPMLVMRERHGFRWKHHDRFRERGCW